jgi:group I intron endonuclease
MAISGIYKITSPTGKIYVGQSWNINKRLNDYKCCISESQRKLYNSFKKYGADNHKFDIVTKLDNPSQEQLDNLEVNYISDYGKEYELLNIRGGGNGGKHSEETKLKISESLKKIGNQREGYITPKETKLKISEAKKGKPSPNKGKIYSKDVTVEWGKRRMGKCVGKNHWRTKDLINLETGEVYNSITSAAKSVGIKRTTLNAMLSGQNKNTSQIEYL